MFLGDDINDLTVLPNISLFIVPSNAHIGCKRKASYISNFEGGKGFIRDIVDNLLISKNIDPYYHLKLKIINNLNKKNLFTFTFLNTLNLNLNI